MEFELRDHVEDIKKIYVARHPVTGQANYHVGYCSLPDSSWSLIVCHQLRDSHIEELDDWLVRRFDEYGSADAGTDTGGE